MQQLQKEIIMKARKKNSNNEWQDIVYVQLKDSDILYKQEYLEFDTLSTELKTNEQNSYERIINRRKSKSLFQSS